MIMKALLLIWAIGATVFAAVGWMREPPAVRSASSRPVHRGAEDGARQLGRGEKKGRAATWFSSNRAGCAIVRRRQQQPAALLSGTVSPRGTVFPVLRDGATS